MRKASLLIIIPLLLTGCVSLTVPKLPSQQFQTIPSKTRQERLDALTTWKIRGAFSIQYRKKATIANYTWQQFGMRHYVININSSLNLYALRLEGQPGSVKLWRSQGSPIHATSAEQLLRRTMGWRLPITDLYFWVRGIPAPLKYTAKYDQYGHIIAMRQQGWRVQFGEYEHDAKAGVDLPRLLRISRPGLHIKIVIKSWNIDGFTPQINPRNKTSY
jgi:outer membrane lipoprotein LolB